MQEALADKTAPEYHLARFAKNVSQVVVGCAGEDDFQLDVWASADTPARAAAMARNCEGFVKAVKKLVAPGTTTATVSEHANAAALRFAREVLNRTAVHRDGTVVTVHTDVASGLNTLLTAYAKEMMYGKK
jgi:hypothetical protein